MIRSAIRFAITLQIMAIAGITSALSTEASDSLTLDSCYAMALRNYPLVKQYELIEKAEAYNLSNANKAYLPQLDITGIGAYIFKGLPTITLPGSEPQDETKAAFIGIGQLNQVIWDGGATKTQKDMIRAGTELEKANLDASVYALNERINQIYFGILLIDEQLKQLDLQSNMLNKNLKRIQLSKINGLAYQTDVDELKAELLKLDQRKIEYAFTRKGFIQMLSFFIGVDLNDRTAFKIPEIELAGLSQMAIKRPELSIYASQRKLEEQRAGMDKVSLMPKFGLLGAGILVTPGISFAASEVSSLAIGGLSVSWGLSGLYKSGNNRQLSQLKLMRISNEQEAFLFNTNLQLTDQSANVDKFSALLRNDHEMVQLRSKIRQAYQVKYENGMCALNDLLMAADKESEARAGEAMHRIQWIMSKVEQKTTSGN